MYNINKELSPCENNFADPDGSLPIKGMYM